VAVVRRRYPAPDQSLCFERPERGTERPWIRPQMGRQLLLGKVVVEAPQGPEGRPGQFGLREGLELPGLPGPSGAAVRSAAPHDATAKSWEAAAPASAGWSQ
jgi:hypothetical protein